MFQIDNTTARTAPRSNKSSKLALIIFGTLLGIALGVGATKARLEFNERRANEEEAHRIQKEYNMGWINGQKPGQALKSYRDVNKSIEEAKELCSSIDPRGGWFMKYLSDKSYEKLEKIAGQEPVDLTRYLF